MEPIEYQKLAAYERWYWWYRAERGILLKTVRSLNLAPGARLLDAGCGSGQTLIELRRALGIRGYGVDLSVHAAALWNGERSNSDDAAANGADGVTRCLASVNELPYATETFDCVLSVDVLECKQVDPFAALTEMTRVLRLGGSAVVLAPAFQSLLSTHDAAVHSVKRFRRGELRALAIRVGLTVERCTYLFPALFPVLAASRWARRFLHAGNGTPPQSDLAPLPKWVNQALLTATRLQQRAAEFCGAPFGSTVLLVARKEGNSGV